MKTYTRKEVAFLRKNYKTVNASEIAVSFGRSTRAVMQKAYSLGLAKNKRSKGKTVFKNQLTISLTGKSISQVVTLVNMLNKNKIAFTEK